MNVVVWLVTALAGLGPARLARVPGVWIRRPYDGSPSARPRLSRLAGQQWWRFGNIRYRRLACAGRRPVGLRRPSAYGLRTDLRDDMSSGPWRVLGLGMR